METKAKEIASLCLSPFKGGQEFRYRVEYITPGMDAAGACWQDAGEYKTTDEAEGRVSDLFERLSQAAGVKMRIIETITNVSVWNEYRIGHCKKA
jgi:hypothetical protein